PAAALRLPRPDAPHPPVRRAGRRIPRRRRRRRPRHRHLEPARRLRPAAEVARRAQVRHRPPPDAGRPRRLPAGGPDGRGGRTAYAELHRGDYAATGAVPQDSEDLINYPRSLAGVEVALFLMEQPRGGVKVSFRSQARVDVAKVAEQFGGGGHRLASGATLDDPLPEARARVLAAVAAALDALP